MKENFTVTDKETGKTYWISRAMAVSGIILSLHDGEYHILLERRGPGCPDNVGKLCGVCGYLNWDETRKDAFIREAYEETGLSLQHGHVVEVGTIDEPTADARQNVVTRYMALIPYQLLTHAIEVETINTDTKSRGGEANEVSELKMYTLSEIEKLDDSEFAFNHKNMIREIIEKIDKH